MRKQIFCLVGVLSILGTAASVSAGELSVKIADGRATIIAKDVPVRQILAEWARVGDTKLVNAERVAGGPVTLELVDVPEKEALDILLRTAAGYIAAPRPANIAGASQFDRVIILPTSRAPVATASIPPPAFGRPAVQPIIQPPPDDDDGDPGDQGPMPPPVMGPNGAVQQTFPGAPVGPNGFPGPTVGPNGQVLGTSVPMTVPAGATPNVNPNQVPNQVPTTAPRPGMLPQQPQPQPFPPNPYAPAVRPGQPPPTRPGGETDR